MPTLLERMTTAAARREPRDLLSLRSDTSLAKLAANAVTGLDGGKVLSAVPVCKVGSFNGGDAMGGIDLDAADLAAVAQRFAMLAPDVLVPPVRLDHGYSVRDIIGSVAALSVQELPDSSDGGVVKPYLVADLHIVDEQALRLMKLGLLRTRSAELSPYLTNAGTMHPLVLWGLAFVDIPAVEGLGPIKLRSGGEEPTGIIELTADTTGAPVSTATDTAAPEQPGPDTAPPAAPAAPQQDAPPRDTPTPDGTPIHDASEQAAASGLPDDAPLDDDTSDDTEGAPAGDTPPADAPSADDPPPTEAQLAAARATLARAGHTIAGPLTPAAALRSAGHTALAEQLERDNAAAVQLRVDGYVRSGKVPGRSTTALAAARTLLGHPDPTVSSAAGALLDAVAAPVKLGERLGQQSSEEGPGGDDTLTVAKLAAQPPEDFPRGWQQLSSEQRTSAEGQAAYTAWRKATGS